MLASRLSALTIADSVCAVILLSRPVPLSLYPTFLLLGLPSLASHSYANQPCQTFALFAFISWSCSLLSSSLLPLLLLHTPFLSRPGPICCSCLVYCFLSLLRMLPEASGCTPPHIYTRTFPPTVPPSGHVLTLYNFLKSSLVFSPVAESAGMVYK